MTFVRYSSVALILAAVLIIALLMVGIHVLLPLWKVPLHVLSHLPRTLM